MQGMRIAPLFFVLSLLSIVLAAHVLPTRAQGCDIASDSCPDYDGDGINNDVDQCPFDAGPASNHGCPQPNDPSDTDDELQQTNPTQAGDRDGDGTPDGLDRCPDAGGHAAIGGCPDADGDGTGDPFDACPQEGGPDWNAGCPADQPAATTNQPGTALQPFIPSPPPTIVADACEGAPQTTAVNVRARPTVNSVVQGTLMPGLTYPLLAAFEVGNETWFALADPPGFVADWVIRRGRCDGRLAFREASGSDMSDVELSLLIGLAAHADALAHAQTIAHLEASLEGLLRADRLQTSTSLVGLRLSALQQLSDSPDSGVGSTIADIIGDPENSDLFVTMMAYLKLINREAHEDRRMARLDIASELVDMPDLSLGNFRESIVSDAVDSLLLSFRAFDQRHRLGPCQDDSQGDAQNLFDPCRAAAAVLFADPNDDGRLSFGDLTESPQAVLDLWVDGANTDEPSHIMTLALNDFDGNGSVDLVGFDWGAPDAEGMLRPVSFSDLDTNGDRQVTSADFNAIVQPPGMTSGIAGRDQFIIGDGDADGHYEVQHWPASL